MYIQPSQADRGALDSDNSSIALAISLSVKFCQTILFIPAGMEAHSWNVGGQRNTMALHSFFFSSNMVFDVV